LCEFEVSTTQVSRAAAELEELLTQWQKRPLGEISFLYVDARYEKVREAKLCARLSLCAPLGNEKPEPDGLWLLAPSKGFDFSNGEWIRTTDLRVTPYHARCGMSQNPESVPFVQRAMSTLAPAQVQVWAGLPVVIAVSLLLNFQNLCS